MAADFDPTPTTDTLGRRAGSLDPDRPEQDDGSDPGVSLPGDANGPGASLPGDRHGPSDASLAWLQGEPAHPDAHDQPAEGGRAEAADPA